MINHVKQTVEMEKKIKDGTIEDTRILQTLHNETQNKILNDTKTYQMKIKKIKKSNINFQD